MKNERSKIRALFAFGIVIVLLLLSSAEPVSVGNFEFIITSESHSLGQHETFGTLRNTDTQFSQTFGLVMILRNSTADLTQINNLEVATWELIDYAETQYIDNATTETYLYFDGLMNLSRTSDNNCWDNGSTEFYCNLTRKINNGTITKQKYDWQELKKKANEPKLNKTKEKLKTNYDNLIVLKKNGAEKFSIIILIIHS